MHAHRDLMAATLGAAVFFALPEYTVGSFGFCGAWFALGMAWSRLTGEPPPRRQPLEDRWRQARDATQRVRIRWVGAAIAGVLAIVCVGQGAFRVNQVMLDRIDWHLSLDPVVVIPLAVVGACGVLLRRMWGPAWAAVARREEELRVAAARLVRSEMAGAVEVSEVVELRVVTPVPPTFSTAEQRIRYADEPSRVLLEECRRLGWRVDGDGLTMVVPHAHGQLPSMLPAIDRARRILVDRWRTRGAEPLQTLVARAAIESDPADRSHLLEELRDADLLSREVCLAWVDRVPGCSALIAADELEEPERRDALVRRACDPRISAEDRLLAGLATGEDPWDWWQEGDPAVATYLEDWVGSREVGQALVEHLSRRPSPAWRSHAVALLVHTGIVWQGDGAAAAEALLDQLQREGQMEDAAALRGLEGAGGTIGVKLGLVYDTLIERAPEAGGLSLAESVPVGGISEASVKAGGLTHV